MHDRPELVAAELLATTVVGRDPELAAIDSFVEAAATGRGSVVFILGEAGIGKSRLARAAADTAERLGFTVLQGRAVPTTTPVPYRPLAEALSAAVRAGVGGRDLPDPFRAPLATLVPDWRTPGEAFPPSVLVIAESIVRFLRAAADAGSFVLLEDLHWADPETLAIVEYLADHLADEPTLCIVTIRDEGHSDGLELARTLHARRSAQLLELSRLGDDDVARMVASCVGGDVEPADLVDFTARADGVPFLVEELLAVAAASGDLVRDGASWSIGSGSAPVVPLTFADSVRRRLSTLSASTRSVLGAAAVLGRRFDWELLPGIVGLGEPDVTDALRAAVHVHLVTVDDEGFRFRHALSREAVLADLLPPERRRFSIAALETIERTQPGLPGGWCELAAEMAEAAGERQRAAALLWQSGRRALDAGALRSAEATLDRARLLADGSLLADVEESLTTVLALAGRYHDARATGERLIERLAADDHGDARRAAVHLRLATAAIAASHWSDADRHIAAGSAAAAAVSDAALSARIDVVAAQLAVLRSPDQAESRARSALAAATTLGLDEVRCEALEIIGRLERSRDLDAAEGTFQQALEVATTGSDEVAQMRAVHELGTIDMLRNGDIDRLMDARDRSVRLGAPATTAVVDVQIGAALAIRDDPEPAVDVCRRAASIARRHQLPQTLATALAFEALTHARSARFTEHDRCVEEARTVGGDQPEVGHNVSFAAAHVGVIRDDRRAAITALQDGTVPGTGAVGAETTGTNRGLLTLLLAAAGSEEAAAWLDPPPVHFLGRAPACFAQAIMAGRHGDVSRASCHLGEGLDLLDGFSWYRHLGLRHVAEAAIADRWGDPATWLVDALAFFDARGEDRLASACRSLLRRAGVPVPRRRTPLATDETLRALGVTEREAEVLELVGSGMTNTEIAARLYLSPRTVERHVANCLDKTGAANRTELVAFAARTLRPVIPS